MWSFVARKKNKQWIWLAFDVVSTEIVGVYIGSRDRFEKYTEKKGYCAIGSVKSNIGHASAAAGVAGMIKVLLSMKYGKIPPSLHFKSRNRHIDFENSPFYVNTELKDWSPARGLPRRAAVSAFGFSGVNAHVALEEYPPSETAVKEDIHSPYLLVLSAKDVDRLKAYTAKLIRFLEENGEEISIADIAYTLQIGRAAMEERMSVVFKDRSELLSKLKEHLAGDEEIPALYRDNIKTDRAKSELLISGESGRRFIEAVIENKEFNKLAQLWVSGVEVDWNLLYAGNRPKKISAPTYPFARKRCWIPETTKKPFAAKTGPSMGAHPLIDINVSDFREQAFEKEFNGEEFYLTDHRVEGEKILPGAACLEMARAAAELARGKTPVRRLKNLTWIRPVKVGAEPERVKISLHPEKEMVLWRIAAAESVETIYSQGELEYLLEKENRTSSALELEEIGKRCSETKSKAEFYQKFEKLGIEYGPTFQTVESISYNLIIPKCSQILWLLYKPEISS